MFGEAFWDEGYFLNLWLHTLSTPFNEIAPEVRCARTCPMNPHVHNAELALLGLVGGDRSSKLPIRLQSRQQSRKFLHCQGVISRPFVTFCAALDPRHKEKTSALYKATEKGTMYI